jgi:hypothetical protein
VSRPSRRRRNRLAERLVWLEALKLTLAFAFLVPAWALLGTFLFSARDSGFPAAPGLLAGTALGVFFGLAFGGTMRWRVWDYLFEPARPRRRRN